MHQPHKFLKDYKQKERLYQILNTLLVAFLYTSIALA